MISGHCIVGKNCFFGVNSSVGDQVNVGKDCLVGAGALLLKNCKDAEVYKATRTEAALVSSLKLAKIKAEHEVE